MSNDTTQINITHDALNLKEFQQLSLRPSSEAGILVTSSVKLRKAGKQCGLSTVCLLLEKPKIGTPAVFTKLDFSCAQDDALARKSHKVCLLVSRRRQGVCTVS